MVYDSGDAFDVDGEVFEVVSFVAECDVEYEVSVVCDEELSVHCSAEYAVESQVSESFSDACEAEGHDCDW